MKEGTKVKTLIVEDLKDLKASLADFDGDVEEIAVRPGGDTDMISLIGKLKGLTLFEVVAKPDPNLQGLGFTLDYHAVNPIPIKDAVFTDEENMIFNGDIKIPWESKIEVPVIGGYFLDEEEANELCREINVMTAKRVDKLAEVLAKSQKFRRDIANDSMS